MKKLILLCLGIFLISLASASISFVDSYIGNPYISYQYIYVNAEPGVINFSYIMEYFENNPIAERNITYPRAYGAGNDTHPYELNEGDISEWTASEGVLSNETTNVFYGNQALAINDTSGEFIVSWNLNDQFFTNTGYHYFDFSHAREVRFMVYSNQSVNISKVVLNQAYSLTDFDRYEYNFEKYKNDVWEIPANTWTEVRVDLIKDMLNIDSRYYAERWSRISITFDSSADIILDGTRWVLEDPTPYIKRPDHYISPVGMYIQNTDFDDEGFIFESTSLTSLDLFGRLTFAGGDVTFGSDLYGGVLIGRSPTSADNAGSYGWDFRASTGDTYDIRGIRVAGSKGTTGASIRPFTQSSTATFTIKDSQFYSIGDIYYDAVSGSDFNMTNILIGQSRYSIWGADHEYINFNNYVYYFYFIWVDEGTIRGLTPKTSYVKISFQRSYQRPSNSHDLVNLINFDKSFLSDSQYLEIRLYEKIGYSNITLETRILNELNINFIDEDGNPIENVSVVINSTSGTTLDSGLSDSDGIYNEDILETDILLHENHTNGIGSHLVKYYPTTGASTTFPLDVTNYSVIQTNPITISISKINYAPQNYIYNLTGKQDWTITLEDRNWNYSKIPEWKILNDTKHTILKINEDGDLAIAGEIFENTNSPPPGVNILWNWNNILWLDDLGNLYLNKLLELIT